MKITTCLPYKWSEMENIKTNGALVDMSEIHFINVPEQDKIFTSLIFLSNTSEYPCELDFSKMKYDEKVDILKKYISCDLRVKNNEFSSSWCVILLTLIGYDCHDQYCLLTKEELRTFIDTNVEYLGTILQFFISLPLFCISRFKPDDEECIVMEGIDSTDDIPVGINGIYVLSQPNICYLFTHDYDLKPLNYTKVFCLENEELFNAIQVLPYIEVLLGLSIETPSKWREIFEEVYKVLDTADSQCPQIPTE